MDTYRFTNFNNDISMRDFMKFFEEYGNESLETTVVAFLSFGCLLPKKLLMSDVTTFLEELNNMERYIRKENKVRILLTKKIESKKIHFESI